MDKKKIEELLREYLSGNPSVEGKKLYQQWYDSFQDDPAILESLEKEKVKTELFEMIKNKISTEEKGFKQPDEYIPAAGRNPNRRTWLRVAAAIVVLIAVSFLFNLFLQPKEIVHKTAFGERLNFTLPDGTEVDLNAHSTLKYFSDNPRKVQLQGEAFFRVKKKPESGAKFLVVTDELTVEVLGTVFNVNSRDELTQVVLEEGKVVLKMNNGIQKEMKPGNLVSFSSKMNKVVEEKQTVRVELHTSWKDGTLIFDNLPLRKAMQKIEETYGLKVVFQNEESGNKTINGGVPMENLDICIKTIEKSAGVIIEKIDNQLVIHTID